MMNRNLVEDQLSKIVNVIEGKFLINEIQPNYQGVTFSKVD